MSKIEKVCSTCKYRPGDEHCKGCTFDWKNADGNTHWEPKEEVCRDDKMQVLRKIKAEIENENKRQNEIALGCNDPHEVRTHLQLANAYAYCMFIIDKYMAESEEQK